MTDYKIAANSRPLLPFGVRSKIYSYLSMAELIEKESLLSKYERHRVIAENNLLDQELPIKIFSCKDVHRYVIRVANHVEISLAGQEEDDLVEILEFIKDSSRNHTKKITITIDRGNFNK